MLELETRKNRLHAAHKQFPVRVCLFSVEVTRSLTACTSFNCPYTTDVLMLLTSETVADHSSSPAGPETQARASARCPPSLRSLPCPGLEQLQALPPCPLAWLQDRAVRRLGLSASHVRLTWRNLSAAGMYYSGLGKSQFGPNFVGWVKLLLKQWVESEFYT